MSTERTADVPVITYESPAGKREIAVDDINKLYGNFIEVPLEDSNQGPRLLSTSRIYHIDIGVDEAKDERSEEPDRPDAR